MKKTFVRDYFEITNLGFGAWAIGGGSYGNVNKQQAFETLDAYLACGGNLIDTAQGYAKSEELIGEYLKEKGLTNKVIIATKSPAGDTMDTVCQIENDVNTALKKLNRDYIDIYYLHSPPEEDEVIEKALDVLEKLKKEGKIRAIGASIKGVDVTDSVVELCKKYIDTGKVDVIQLVYSIFRQKTVSILDYAKEHGVAIVGRTALESGFLTGKFTKDHQFEKDDHRNRWNDGKEYIFEQAEELKNEMLKNNWDDNLLSLALRFAIKPTGITSTIVGAKSAEQMQGIVNAFEKGEISNKIERILIDKYFALNDKFNTV